MPKSILILILIPFSVLTGLALRDHGVWGIIEPHFKSYGAGQVFADLCIALTLMLVQIWRDAKQTGRNFWLWLAVTLATGSFGPLLYLLTRREQPDKIAA
ncbi:MAG: DUF2834 domain-containing protein [Acidobacteria bacterium]|nr:DUF2834 domain-containing protein [Acidobacteriota bacterium]